MAVELFDDESLDSFQDVTIEDEGTPASEPQADEQQPTPSLPTKYAGKSVEEIVQMHIEAERLIGRQAQEVGEVRKLADELIKRELTKGSPNPQTSEPEDEVDFFTDPEKAVSRLVENHPAVKEAKDFTVRTQREKALQSLHSDHPDFQEVVASNDFQTWVMGSRIRQALFIEANQNFDYDAANELLGSFKAISATRRQAEEAEVSQVKDTASKARKAGAVTTGSGSGETGGKKIYRRADILRKQIQDPAWYEQNADAILQAYAEGRVK